MKAIVLGAGYATRLHPLTLDQAKPLLDVGGRPILSRILDRVLEMQELSEIVVVSNHRFVSQFEAWQRQYRTSIPLRVLDDRSQNEADRLGAVGDIAFALGELSLGAEDWMVVAGDNLIETSYASLQREFAAERKPMIVVRESPVVKSGTRSRYNEVTVASDGRVTCFREKPFDPQSGLAAIALYFLPAAAAPLVAEYLDAGGEADAPGYWLEWLVGRTEVRAARLQGRWIDIGNHEALEAARALFAGVPG